MIKTLVFCLSLVLAQQQINIDSEEFTSAVHQRLLERRDFYVSGTEMEVEKSLRNIEETMLVEFQLDHTINQ